MFYLTIMDEGKERLLSTKDISEVDMIINWSRAKSLLFLFLREVERMEALSQKRLSSG